MAATQIKNGFHGGSDDQLLVNPDGSINVNTTGGGGGSNASVGANNTAAPGYSTQIGAIDLVTGKLVPLQVDSLGRLVVDAGQIFGVQNVVVSYNEVDSIAVGIETTITSYTAPAGKISYLLSISTTGENRSQFNVYNNGVLLDRQYTNVTQLAAPFDYKTGSSTVPGFVIAEGNTLSVSAINSGTTTATYNCRLLILEVTP